MAAYPGGVVGQLGHVHGLVHHALHQHPPHHSYPSSFLLNQYCGAGKYAREFELNLLEGD